MSEFPQIRTFEKVYKEDQELLSSRERRAGKKANNFTTLKIDFLYDQKHDVYISGNKILILLDEERNWAPIESGKDITNYIIDNNLDENNIEVSDYEKSKSNTYFVYFVIDAMDLYLEGYIYLDFTDSNVDAGSIDIKFDCKKYMKNVDPDMYSKVRQYLSGQSRKKRRLE